MEISSWIGWQLKVDREGTEKVQGEDVGQSTAQTGYG